MTFSCKACNSKSAHKIWNGFARLGKIGDLIDGVRIGGASAVLAASIFHFGEISIQDTKLAMSKAGISVRL